MELLKALILGITQGLTEFIPVSSSGHLIVVGHLLNFKYTGLGFDTALDIGTLAALLVFFRHDIKDLILGIFGKTPDTRLAWLIVLATVPGVIGGIALQHLAETTFRSSSLVAMNLILIAFVMLAADKLGQRKLGIDKITTGRAMIIGLSQVLALVPGVSRSGITISAGLLTGLEGVAATRFSFLLSAPIIAGATAKVLVSKDHWGQLTAEPLIYAVGIIAAFISGLWAIRFMIGYLARHGLSAFAYYRIVVGLLILIFMRG